MLPCTPSESKRYVVPTPSCAVRTFFTSSCHASSPPAPVTLCVTPHFLLHTARCPRRPPGQPAPSRSPWSLGPPPPSSASHPQSAVASPQLPEATMRRSCARSRPTCRRPPTRWAIHFACAYRAYLFHASLMMSSCLHILELPMMHHISVFCSSHRSAPHQSLWLTQPHLPLKPSVTPPASPCSSL